MFFPILLGFLLIAGGIFIGWLWFGFATADERARRIEAELAFDEMIASNELWRSLWTAHAVTRQRESALAELKLVA